MAGLSRACRRIQLRNKRGAGVPFALFRYTFRGFEDLEGGLLKKTGTRSVPVLFI